MLTPLWTRYTQFPSGRSSGPPAYCTSMHIMLASEDALKKALDTSPHTDQMESIKIIRRLSKLIDKYLEINIIFLWLPKKSQFVGFRHTKQLALEAVRTADLTNFNEPQMIDNQIKHTEQEAIEAWTTCYNQAPYM